MNNLLDVPEPPAQWRPSTNGAAAIEVRGRLDATTVPLAWEAVVLPARNARFTTLKVDASCLAYCDGAGLGLFAELRRIAVSAGAKFEVVNAPGEMQRLIDLSLLKDPAARVLVAPPGPSFVARVGEAAADLAADIRQLVAFVGEIAAALLWAVTRPRRLRWADMFRIAEKAGVDALPVVALLGLLIGVILAFQTAGPLRKFGAESMIPTLVAVAVVREMGPLITAIILAGRSGSAFAAEIGTMKVTEELAALETMGLAPTQFLMVPRILAALVVMPVLTTFNILLSIVGGYIVMAGLGYSLSYYVNSVQGSITYVDLIGGIVKSAVFALIIAAIGCLRGAQTRSGPGAVGDSTTRAVVAGIVLTLAADAVLGVVYFALGI